MNKKLNKLNNKGGLLISTKKNQDYLFSVEGIKGEIFAINDIINKDLFSFNNNKGEHIVRIKPNNDILFKKLEQLPNPLNVIVIDEDGKIGLGDGSGIGGGGIYINTNLAPETIGGYLQGEPITPPEGLNDTEFKDKLFSSIILPTISFNVNNTNIEIGSDFNQNISINYTQNDAGNLIFYSLRKNGGEISNTQLTIFEELNVISQFILQAFVSYSAGNGISSGIINTPIRTITPRFKYWYYSGSLSTSPTTNTEVRLLGDNGLITGQTIQAIIAQGDTEFSIYIPATESLDSVIYVESSNADITANFNQTLISVNDAGGTLRSYKKLTQTIGGIGYTADATYLITLQ